MKSIYSRSASLILAAMLSTSSMGLAAAETASNAVGKETYHIVALGDSVTVGYEPHVTNNADIYGYADRLYTQALLHGRAELANYGIMGLRTEGLTHLLEGIEAGTALTADQLQDFSRFDPLVQQQAAGVAKQTSAIRDSLSQADLVVMTIGGNDFTDLVEGLAGKSIDDAIAYFNPLFDERLNNYAKKVQEEIRKIHVLAPNARIEIADQYLPIPKMADQKLYNALYEDIDKLSTQLGTMTDALSSEGISAKVIHVGSLFKGSETVNIHLSLIPSENDIHPTQAGYELMAQAFAEPIWTTYTPLKPVDKRVSPAPAVYLSGQLLTTQNKPKLKNGTTFLAISDVATATGATLKWNNQTKTATFSRNGREVQLTIGSRTVLVNGTAQKLNEPAYLETVDKQPKTYVPLAAIASGLDYQVIYNAKLHTAFINP